LGALAGAIIGNNSRSHDALAAPRWRLCLYPRLLALTKAAVPVIL
jgi:hypothetical protein